MDAGFNGGPRRWGLGADCTLPRGLCASCLSLWRAVLHHDARELNVWRQMMTARRYGAFSICMIHDKIDKLKSKKSAAASLCLRTQPLQGVVSRDTLELVTE